MDNTVILKVQLDEGKTTDRLAVLTAGLAKTRDEQKQLTLARQQGLISDEAFGKQSVELGRQLRAQQDEQRALTKNLDLYNKAVSGVGGSYAQSQAQLSLAQKQYQQLAGSAENSTEETQALSKVIDELRGTLKTTDAGMGLFVRNVGNYSGAVEPLIAELKRLEIQQGQLSKDDPQREKIEQSRIGFLQRINQAGAEAGMSYEQTQAKLKGYGNSIAPVIEQLVKLEEEQKQVVEGSEQYNRIGFQMQKLKKEISEVPAENVKLVDSLEAVDEATGAFGGHVGGLKDAWDKAQQGAKAAQLGLTGIKAAFAATGIGLFIIALGLLYEYFTKTDEGQEQFAAGLSYLKGLFSVLEGVAISAGKALALMFTDPKKAASDFASFIGNNLLNRVKSFGVLWDSIKNGDATKLQDSIVQFTTGIENGTAKAKALTDEMKRAAEAAYALSRAQDQLDDAQRESLLVLEQNKNLIDQLVLSARDRSLSEKERLANLDRASKLEMQGLQKNLELAERKLRIIQAQNDEAERTGKLSDEQRDADVAAQVEVVRLQGQSATLQQSIANRRSVLIQTELADEKAKRDKAAAEEAKRQDLLLAQKREALQLDLLRIDQQVKAVADGSDEELNLLQRKLAKQREIDLAQKNLTVGAKKLIDAKYEADTDDLFLSSIRKRAGVALQVEAGAIAVRLTKVKQGSDDEVALQKEAIEKQRQQQLAAISERTQGEDRASQERIINANAEQQTTELTYQSRLKAVQAFYQQERNALETARASGAITEQQYQQTLFQQEIGGIAAIRQLNQAFNRDTAADDQALTDRKIENLQRVTDKEREQTQARIVLAQDLGASIGELFAQTINDTGATLEDFVAKTLVILLDSLEKVVLAATVEATAKTIAGLPFPLGIIAAAGQVALIKGAFGAVKGALSAPSDKKFEAGTVLGGAPHSQGGVQLYDRYSGQHMGEAEQDEIILTKGVWRSPLLRPLASILNVLGGGRQLAPARYMAVGGVAQSSMVRDSLSGGQALPSAAEIGAATAEALRKSPPITRISDVKDGLNRSEFTSNMVND